MRVGEVTPCVQYKHRSFEWYQYLKSNHLGRRPFLPVYELGTDGLSFANVIAMRAAKYLDYLAIRSWAPNVEFLTFETATNEFAFNQWQAMISNKYDIHLEEPPAEVSTRPKRRPIPLSCKLRLCYTQQTLDWVNSQLNETTEKSIGYHLVRTLEDLPKRLWQPSTED